MYLVSAKKDPWRARLASAALPTVRFFEVGTSKNSNDDRDPDPDPDDHIKPTKCVYVCAVLFTRVLTQEFADGCRQEARPDREEAYAPFLRPSGLKSTILTPVIDTKRFNRHQSDRFKCEDGSTRTGK